MPTSVLEQDSNTKMVKRSADLIGAQAELRDSQGGLTVSVDVKQQRTAESQSSGAV